MTKKELKKYFTKSSEGKASVKEERVLAELEESIISKNQNRVFTDEIEKSKIKKEIYGDVTQRKNRKRKPWLSIAASLIILIGLGSIYFSAEVNNLNNLTVINNSKGFKIVKLSDGSKVTMNEKSEIQFKNNYNGTRYLELTGEAFFEIARDENKPFIVKTRSLKTTVLGTSFNVKDNGSIINITVATGLVEVSDDKNIVQLRPNQKTNYNTLTKVFKTENTPHELCLSWFKEIIKLERVNMEQLGEFLNHNYGCTVIFPDKKLKKVEMSLVISKNEDLKSVLQKINYISGLKLTQKQNNMVEVKY